MSRDERSSFDVLDDAFHLLREIRADAWVVYFTGAVPFLLALLWAATETNILYTPQKGLGNAFLCAAAFVWMQFWRVRFAKRLEAHLRGAVAEPQTVSGAFRSVCLQTGFQSAKMVVLPVAAFLMLPWAWVVCFFQNLTVLASHGPVPLRRSVSDAARFAAGGQRQLWIVLALIGALALCVFLNVAILALILPSLVKALSGFENEFTRGTGNPFTWRLLEVAGGITWLLITPLLQAVFVQRLYRTETARTGADLLAALRRPAALTATLVCFVATVHAEIPPGDLQKSIGQVLEERQYSWQEREKVKDAEDTHSLLGLVAHQTRRALDSIGLAFQVIGEWLKRLFEQTPVETESKAGHPPSASLRWITVILIGVIAVGLAVFLRRSRRTKPAVPTQAAAPTVNLEDPSVRAADLPEQAWIAIARQCAEREEYRLALRALYLATLAYLGQRGLLVLDGAKTDRDYVRELTRRASSEHLHGLFRDSVRGFEACWYGRHETGERNLAEFQSNFETLRTHADRQPA